jgi:hypothetical protein
MFDSSLRALALGRPMVLDGEVAVPDEIGIIIWISCTRPCPVAGRSAWPFSFSTCCSSTAST